MPNSTRRHIGNRAASQAMMHENTRSRSAAASGGTPSLAREEADDQAAALIRQADGRPPTRASIGSVRIKHGCMLNVVCVACCVCCYVLFRPLRQATTLSPARNLCVLFDLCV